MFLHWIHPGLIILIVLLYDSLLSVSSQHDALVLHWSEANVVEGSMAEYDCGKLEVRLISTLDKSRLKESDLVVLYIPTVPRERYNDIYTTMASTSGMTQPPAWVIKSGESPAYYPILADEAFTNKFNYKISYRRDSVGRTPYHKRSRKLILESPIPVQTLAEKEKNASQHNMPTKMAPIMWAVSHCTTKNEREHYAFELGRHIPVDNYGRCGNNAEWPSWMDEEATARKSGHMSNQLRTLVSLYPFYLAFENSNCDDYVTEKFWRTLEARTVPIYLGAPNIREFAPQGSYIDATAFASPRDLAAYLKKILANQTAYDAFFDYTRRLPREDEYVDMFTEKVEPALQSVVCQMFSDRANNITRHVAADTSCIEPDHVVHHVPSESLKAVLQPMVDPFDTVETSDGDPLPIQAEQLYKFAAAAVSFASIAMILYQMRRSKPHLQRTTALNHKSASQRHRQTHIVLG